MQGAVQILSQDKAKPLTACEQEKDMLRLPLLSLSGVGQDEPWG